MTKEERMKSNETMREALRRKGMLIFTFEKNAHSIKIADKEHENVVIRVSDGEHVYTFDLSNISACNGDFERLLEEYDELYGKITIRCTNIFKNEIFVGEELEEKEFIESVEVEEYTTTEEIVSIYYKVMN